MKIINLSAEPTGKIRSWIPIGLDAEKVVFLPDACPGKSPLPTGTAVLTYQTNWRQFAVSDCGCGMRLLRSSLLASDFASAPWDKVAEALRKNKGSLGDLGGGNHFLDALQAYNNDHLHFLIHTGSRSESGIVDAYVDDPDKFDYVYDQVTGWAVANRLYVQHALEQEFGKLGVILDLPHNTYELQPDGGVLIYKGAVAVKPGDLNIIPSHMAGDVSLVRATPNVSEILCSLSHGTGRAMSRAECKPLGDLYDFERLRERVLIPEVVQDASLRTEGPFAYRDLDACLSLLGGYVEEVERYSVIGYMGHL